MNYPLIILWLLLGYVYHNSVHNYRDFQKKVGWSFIFSIGLHSFYLFLFSTIIFYSILFINYYTKIDLQSIYAEFINILLLNKYKDTLFEHKIIICITFLGFIFSCILPSIPLLCYKLLNKLDIILINKYSTNLINKISIKPLENTYNLFRNRKPFNILDKLPTNHFETFISLQEKKGSKFYVLITLKCRRVYLGTIKEIDDDFIYLIPLASGYRNEKGKVKFTTKYELTENNNINEITPKKYGSTTSDRYNYKAKNIMNNLDYHYFIRSDEVSTINSFIFKITKLVHFKEQNLKLGVFEEDLKEIRSFFTKIIIKKLKEIQLYELVEKNFKEEHENEEEITLEYLIGYKTINSIIAELDNNYFSGMKIKSDS